MYLDRKVYHIYIIKRFYYYLMGNVFPIKGCGENILIWIEWHKVHSPDAQGTSSHRYPSVRNLLEFVSPKAGNMF